MNATKPQAKVLSVGNLRIVGDDAKILTHRNVLVIQFENPIHLLNAIKAGVLDFSEKEKAAEEPMSPQEFDSRLTSACA